MTIDLDPTIERATTSWPLVARELGPDLRGAAAEHDRTGTVSAAAFERLRAAGLTGALVPLEFGGGGATHDEAGAILRELGRWDPAVAVTLSMHTHLVAAQVWRHKHGQDAEKVLRAVASGKILVSTGASDWVSSNGSTRRVDGGYRITARKGPASGCEIGQILVTSIRWEDAPDGPQVLHCAVPLDAEGVTIDLTWDTLGLRATGSHTVVLDDVFVPDAAVSLARPADRWHPVWNTVMGAAMPLIMAAYLGIADAAVEAALAAARGRREPHVVHLLGEMLNAHVTADDLVQAMLASSDDLRFANTDEHASRTLARKSVAAEAMIQTVRAAVEVAGGIGYSRASVLERLLRDVHGVTFHPLPRSRQLGFTGRVALGLSPVE